MCLPLFATHARPPEELVPGFRQTVTSYFDALTALGHKLLRLLALSLELPAAYFDPYFTSPMVALRPLHYSAEVNRVTVHHCCCSCRACYCSEYSLALLPVSDLCGWHCAVVTKLLPPLLLQVSAPDDGVFGAGAHSDYGMLTLLVTDDVPGLQVGWQHPLCSRRSKVSYFHPQMCCYCITAVHSTECFAPDWCSTTHLQD